MAARERIKTNNVALPPAAAASSLFVFGGKKKSRAALFLSFLISSVSFLPLWLFVLDPGMLKRLLLLLLWWVGNNNVMLRKMNRYKRRPRGGIHLSLWVNAISLQIVTPPLNWSCQLINPN